MKSETLEPSTKITVGALQKKLLETEKKLQDEGFVKEICDALFADLDQLCLLMKTKGEDAVNKIRHTSKTWRNRKDDPFRGTYVGFGIGKGWIEFGFLEQAIIHAIRERLEKNSKQYHQDASYHVETMGGGVTVSGGVYMTSTGYYELTRTYAWFLQKRVD